MANSDSFISNLDKIFTGSASLKQFYHNYGSGNEDRNIDEWNSSSPTMVIRNSGSKVTLRPRIKSKKERDHLARETQKFYEENREIIESNIIKFVPPQVSYTFEIDTKKETGSTGALTFSVRVYEKDKKTAVLTVFFQAKGLSNGEGGRRSDPHELMTACLIHEQMKIDVDSINRLTDDRKDKKLKEIVDTLATVSSSIQGKAGLDGFYVDSEKKEPDLVNLAKAISVSNYVIDEIGPGKVETVWQTGTKWAQEIKKFNVGPKTIKNYNSSDVIVKFKTSGRKGATHYWGLSLKKRGITKGVPDVEPTLLNKPLMGTKGLIEKKLKQLPGGATDIKKIEDAKLKFFRSAIEVKTGNSLYKGKNVNTMPIKEVLKAANSLFTERNDKSLMLRGQGKYKEIAGGQGNIFFKEIDRVFIKHFDQNKEFFEEFMDLIFKIKLDSYIQDTSFHFSLITGTGDYQNGKIMEVHPPLEKEGRLTAEIFRELFGDPDQTSYRIVQQDNKKHAFEFGSTAAKLFYTMKIGKPGKGVSIVDLEVRYKGELTSEPQFQVFMSVQENNFSQQYKKLAATKTFGPTRWN